MTDSKQLHVVDKGEIGDYYLFNWVGDSTGRIEGCLEKWRKGEKPQAWLWLRFTPTEREKKLEEALRNLIKRCEQDIEFTEYARIESTVVESITVLEEQ